MKINRDLKISILALLIVVVYSCKKNEKLADYRDKWVGNYSCNLNVYYYSDWPVWIDTAWVWQDHSHSKDSSAIVSITKGDSANNLNIFGLNIDVNQNGYSSGGSMGPIDPSNPFNFHLFTIQFYDQDSVKIGYNNYISHFESDYYTYKGKRNR